MSKALEHVSFSPVSTEDVMGYNPELAKIIIKTEELVEAVHKAIGDTSGMSPVIKNGLTVTLDQIRSNLGTVKDIISSPVDPESGKIVATGVAGRPDIHLEGLSLMPSAKEVHINNRVIRLPRAEFVVLYELALRVGHEVMLGHGHSILTRMSNIRRNIPELRHKIESLGRGRYVMHMEYKKQG